MAIDNNGTISKAAAELFISQPALTRSMQKLEKELGVEIFSRQKNKVSLNDCGKLMAGYARRLLEDYSVYIEHIRAVDRSQKTIAVGSCVPAPLWKIVPKLNETFPEKVVTSEIRESGQLVKALSGGEYQVIVTDFFVEAEGCDCREYCKERLYLCLPQEHQLARRKEGLTFAEMDGITMLLYDGIGSWKRVGESLPRTRFIIQTDRTTFNDLAAESTLPYFTTNLSGDSILTEQSFHAGVAKNTILNEEASASKVAAAGEKISGVSLNTILNEEASATRDEPTGGAENNKAYTNEEGATNKVAIPILDEQATKTFYLTTLLNNNSLLDILI